MSRASGTLGDANTFGMLAALWGPAAVVLAQRWRAPWSIVVGVTGVTLAHGRCPDLGFANGADRHQHWPCRGRVRERAGVAARRRGVAAIDEARSRRSCLASSPVAGRRRAGGARVVDHQRRRPRQPRLHSRLRRHSDSRVRARTVVGAIRLRFGSRPDDRRTPARRAPVSEPSTPWSTTSRWSPAARTSFPTTRRTGTVITSPNSVCSAACRCWRGASCLRFALFSRAERAIASPVGVLRGLLVGFGLVSLLGMSGQSLPVVLTFWTLAFWFVTLEGGRGRPDRARGRRRRGASRWRWWSYTRP